MALMARVEWVTGTKRGRAHLRYATVLVDEQATRAGMTLCGKRIAASWKAGDRQDGRACRRCVLFAQKRAVSVRGGKESPA